MKARASENDLAIVRSASTSVDNFWAEIYWGRLFFRAESSLIQSTTDTRNPCVIKVTLLTCFTDIDILTRIFISTRKLTFEIS
jgi:hypothetical protein